MRDRNWNDQKGFLLFGTGTGITKRLSLYLGRERETQKRLPTVREREFMAFPFGNIQERKFPLMPGVQAWLGVLSSLLVDIGLKLYLVHFQIKSA